MAQIIVNEVSQNYTYNIGTSSYCTVALPITASWGPGYFDPATEGVDVQTMLEETSWKRFPATQEGLESFVSTYRGPSANYRLAKDFSYQMAMTLLTAGYDVLVCRMCPGTKASITASGGDGSDNYKVSIKAKYPGTFGNSLMVTANKVPNRDYQNLIVYVVDGSGVRTAVENIVFAYEIEHSSDSIPHVSEVESNFITIEVSGNITDDKGASTILTTPRMLTGGTDRAYNSTESGASAALMKEAIELASIRYGYDSSKSSEVKPDYITVLEGIKDSADLATAATIRYKEWLYTHLVGLSSEVGGVYDLLKDKLSYNPNRIISPGWDDQNIKELNPEISVRRLSDISPIHKKLMDVAYFSRCATAFLDVPKSLPRNAVHGDSIIVLTGKVEGSYVQKSLSDSDGNVLGSSGEGYAQLLARLQPDNSDMNVNTALYSTHSALFAPWGQYMYVGTNKQNIAPPSFFKLMIDRAMILNQSVQYEWALPTNRSHNLSIGKLDYSVPKKVLDTWQNAKEGVGVNVITNVPGLGTCLWGNSTLFEVPPATYQALANLSTRLLFNAVQDLVYRVGVSITFQYNNDAAYSDFYAGVTPLLDTMKNVGAIDGYKIKMSSDINGLDQVNANTVIGKIYLIVNGVINDISVDLIALPPGADLTQF